MKSVSARLLTHLETAKGLGLNAAASAITFLAGEIDIQDARLEVANWRIDSLVLELEAVRGVDVEIPIEGENKPAGELNSPDAPSSD